MRNPKNSKKQTIAAERVSLSVRSVIVAIAMDTFALVMPPIMRLMRKMRNTLDTDHVRYEINVPVYVKNNGEISIL